MKAGNGIIHDEIANLNTETNNPAMHGFQFWINLPPHIKAEQPEYMAIQANEVPQQLLPDNRSWVKVILSNYEQLQSSIPNYTAQFLYHIHLEAGQQFAVPFSEKTEAGEIEVANISQEPIDLLLFGGERYDEPIVAQGPFVMNTQHEISQA
jgi:redox-sensitive bicupin YhaK (pirin superfamily)